MDQLNLIATVAVFITLGLIIGYLVGKRRQKIPETKVLVERITYDYLQERDELLTSVQKTKESKYVRPHVMYAVKDYAWNN